MLASVVLFLGLFDTIRNLNPGHQYDIEQTRSDLIVCGQQGRDFGSKTLANAPQTFVGDLRRLGASEAKTLLFEGWERSTDQAHPPDTHHFRWSSPETEIILTAFRNRKSSGYCYLSHEVRKID